MSKWFKPNTKYIVTSTNGHSFPRGTIVILDYDDGSDVPQFIDDTGDTQWLHKHDVKLLHQIYLGGE